MISHYNYNLWLYNFLGTSVLSQGICTTTVSSTTTPTQPISHDRLYYYLPYWEDKPTVYISSPFPDHRRRMYNSNAIQKVSDKVVSIPGSLLTYKNNDLETITYRGCLFNVGLARVCPSILLG